MDWQQIMQQLAPYLGLAGNVGQRLTPQMQQVAVRSGAVTPQDAATATIANVAPPNMNQPSPMAMPMGGGASLARLAQQLLQPAPERRPQIAPSFHGAGAPPIPIGSRILTNQQRVGPPVAAGASQMSPDLAALAKQLRELNLQTGLY